MPDREKVIQKLEKSFKEMRTNRICMEDVIELEEAAADALALLKEQEARVMTLEEIRERAETVDPDPVFVERKSGSTAWDLYTIDIIYHMAKRSYMDIRVWTSRPSPEQMRETPWEGEKD